MLRKREKEGERERERERDDGLKGGVGEGEDSSFHFDIASPDDRVGNSTNTSQWNRLACYSSL